MPPKPMSMSRAALYAALGCVLILAPLIYLWKWQTGLLVGGLLSALWLIFFFSWQSIKQDDAAHYQRIQAEVAQVPADIRLAIAMAQPLRSLGLLMPIPALTKSFNDYGLYMPGRLPAEQFIHAQITVGDWLAHAREKLELEPDAPLSFVQSMAVLDIPEVASITLAETEGEDLQIAYVCYLFHLLLCAMETEQLPVAQGLQVLTPLTQQIQARYGNWADYAADLQRSKWSYMRKNAWGLAAQATHFHDLLSSPLSPWALTDLHIPRQPIDSSK